MFLLALASLVIAYVVWYYVFFVPRYPKGPLPLPLVGNIFQIRPSDVHLYMRELSLKYGPVYTLFTPRPMVCINDYEHIKEALVTKADHFVGKLQTPPQIFFSWGKNNGGILNGYGQNWKEQRRLALTILRNFGMGKNLMEHQVMRSVTDMVENMDSMADRSKVDMFVPIQLCVGNVINETLFGYIHKHTDTKKFLHFVEIIVDFFEALRSSEMMLLQTWPHLKHVPPLSSAYKETERKMGSYFEFISAEVKQQMEQFDPDAPVTTFVQAYLQEMHKNNNPFLNFHNLVCTVSDFWMAGMETTSTTLRWAILFMAKWPHIQRKAQEEIDRVIGKDRFPTMADKPQMPYMSALLVELQRYANIVAVIPHFCTSDQTVGKHKIPADTVVTLNLYNVLAHDPSFEEPETFNPDRFLEADGKTFKKKAEERLVQFGLGKRQCAGEGLARMELFLILTTLLQRYNFEATGDVDCTPKFTAVTMPYDHPCNITSRI
ncbi:Protein CYP-14A3 [Aphelenchoides avenae]|nr:Protein CYP-14A3 [Aphelenchus avenae]